jgi:hypothetical protein|uniref:Uncharacterized protein n=1 Tax=Zea mays TaxID=4577 RepID=A0A804NPC1_MAIZE
MDAESLKQTGAPLRAGESHGLETRRDGELPGRVAREEIRAGKMPGLGRGWARARGELGRDLGTGRARSSERRGAAQGAGRAGSFARPTMKEKGRAGMGQREARRRPSEGASAGIDSAGKQGDGLRAEQSAAKGCSAGARLEEERSAGRR